jgi:type VI secretion system protein ImpH
MAGANGKTTDRLIEALATHPHAHDFFRAVRLIECSLRDHPRVGTSQSPAKDSIRFGQLPSLAFAPSTIQKIERDSVTNKIRMMVNFFGLLGPNSPLPTHLTEYALERELHFRDRTFAAFLNVFNHRLISFFYRAWAVNQKALDLDRPGEDERFEEFIGAFFGFGVESLEHEDVVQGYAKLYFAGRLASKTRNAEGLEAILQEYFDIPSQLETFFGRWLSLPAEYLCRLGDSPATGTLGTTAIVGSRIWECEMSFRIRLGPMILVDYERMLPNGSSFKRLKSWVLNYCGEQFFWDAQLILRADQVPQTRLGLYGLLGWNTWLKTNEFSTPACGLILHADRVR